MKLVNKYHINWEPFLLNEKVQKELKRIEEFLKDEKYFPSEERVLRFLEQDPKTAKAIIVGMEPYPSSFNESGIVIPEATGRSFEVASIKQWTDKFKQTSLRNILKAIYLTETGQKISMDELREKIQNRSFPISEPNQWFDKLEEQGVIFLNATLTVRQYEVDTHTKLWENFMDYLITYIESVNKDVVWCLLGAKARDRFHPKVDETKAIVTLHPRVDAFIQTDLFTRLKDRISFVV